MTFHISNTVIDEALTYIKDNASHMVLCEGYPANYSDATTANGTGSGVNIATVTLAALGADITLAAGAVDGRKAVMAAKNGVSVTTNGTADHIAWLDDTNTEVLFVTEMASAEVLTTANTVNIPSHFCAGRELVLAT